MSPKTGGMRMCNTNVSHLGIACEMRGGGSGTFCVQLYDCCCRLLTERCCSSLRTEWLTVPAWGEYEICVSACPHSGLYPLRAHRWVHLSPAGATIQYFVFARQPETCAPIHFTLRDAAYPDMPIQGGTLYLWHSML